MLADSPALRSSEAKWFKRSPWSTILWWEKRRLVFNLVILAAGIASIVSVYAVGSLFLNPGEDVEEPLGTIFGVILYGVAANACYTLGWFTELICDVGDSAFALAKREKLFRRGMIFSIVLTLVPGILIPLLWIIFGFHHHLIDGR
jgi:hypothetical protein